MTVTEALILGTLQGLTEFLPVSSSGHLELGNHLLHTPPGENLPFALTVHAATVLSTIVVFRKDLATLITGGLKFNGNPESRYLGKLLLSAVPVGIIGLFFRDRVESLFTGSMIVVGCCLLVTAALLAFAHFRKKGHGMEISWLHSLVIGVAQAMAVLPGISRSGATIATGLILGNDRQEVARFSFLMVLLPILGANLLDLLRQEALSGQAITAWPLIAGFLTAFTVGVLACSWMIRIVNRGKLIYFALYCLLIGVIAIFAA